jgi:dTMP kinase
MIFITLEGIDGSGKSSQLKRLSQNLKQRGFQILETKEPGGSKTGQLIRQIILNPDHKELAAPAEMLLFMADRIQHLNEVIIPALKQEIIVLCDRYHDSTIAYQGGGRQIDLSWLTPVVDKFIIPPGLTLWLDISVEESVKRLEQKTINCRMENEDKLFFQRVRKSYQDIYQANSHRVVCISAENDIETVEQEILKVVLGKINYNIKNS